MYDISLASPLLRRDIAIGVLVLALWAVLTAALYLGTWPPDLSALYFAGHAYGTGQPDLVYAAPESFFGIDDAPAWRVLAADLGHPEAELRPYVYPPLWAVLLAPIATRIDPQSFSDATYVLHIAMLAAMPVLAWRLVRPRMPFAVWTALSVALLTSSVIAMLALYNNQPQIAVAFLTLLAFERLAHGRPAAAGTALGLAAALKLSPLIFVVLFLAGRQWHAAVAFAATGAGLAGLSFLLAGPDLHAQFLDQLDLVAAQVAVWEFNWSLKSATFQLWELARGQPIPAPTLIMDQHPNPPAWLGPAMLATLGLGGAWVLWTTRHMPQTERLTRQLAALSCLVALTGPLGWAHHYLLPLVLLPALLAMSPNRRGAVTLATAGLAVSAPLMFALPGHAGGLNWTALAGTTAMALLIPIFARRI